MNAALSSFIASVLLVAACGVTADTLASRADPTVQRSSPVAKRGIAPRPGTRVALACCGSTKPENHP